MPRRALHDAIQDLEASESRELRVLAGRVPQAGNDVARAGNGVGRERIVADGTRITLKWSATIFRHEVVELAQVQTVRHPPRRFGAAQLMPRMRTTRPLRSTIFVPSTRRKPGTGGYPASPAPLLHLVRMLPM